MSNEVTLDDFDIVQAGSGDLAPRDRTHRWIDIERKNSSVRYACGSHGESAIATPKLNRISVGPIKPN